MLCATPFLKRVQVSERECDDGSKAVLQYTKREFESMLQLRPPQAPADCVDVVIKARTLNSATEQQISIKEREIQALRIAILQKHDELLKVKNAKTLKVKQTDDLLQVMHRNPYLPVEVILRIFELLYFPESIDHKIRSTQDLSLYKLSVGFADFPGWKKAIRAQIPLVLTPGIGSWDSIARQLSSKNQVTLGHHPRLCALSDLHGLAQISLTEPAAAYLTIDANQFENHLAAARRFKLKSLIFSASSLPILRDVLDAAGELLWRVESLEILMDSQFDTHYGGGNDNHEQTLQGLFERPHPIGVLNPALRTACIPWGTLQGLLPLLVCATSLDLVFSSNEFNVTNLLKSLNHLPESIKYLTLRLHYRSRDLPPSGDVDNPIFLPNLLELVVNRFDGWTTNILVKNIHGPNISYLAAEPDMCREENEATTPKERDEKIQFDFLEMAHKNFPNLKRLKYAPPMSALSLGTFFLHHLAKPDAIEGADGERGWLLPTLEVLDITCDWEDVLDLAIVLASARLKSDKVSSLRSLSLPNMDPRALRRKRDVADVWRNTQLTALRVLVPDVKFVSSYGLEL